MPKDSSEKEMKECFNLFDRDSIGKVPRNDLGLMLRALGYHITDKHVEVLVEHQVWFLMFLASTLDGYISVSPRTSEKGLKSMLR